MAFEFKNLFRQDPEKAAKQAEEVEAYNRQEDGDIALLEDMRKLDWAMDNLDPNNPADRDKVINWLDRIRTPMIEFSHNPTSSIERELAARLNELTEKAVPFELHEEDMRPVRDAA